MKISVSEDVKIAMMKGPGVVTYISVEKVIGLLSYVNLKDVKSDNELFGLI